MHSQGAKLIRKTKLTVDWYRPVGTVEGEDPWFLRIGSDSDGKYEVTWKAPSNISGGVRRHKEINFSINHPNELADLFEELGLEKYAHQEKIRTSYTLNDWSFDIDQYPNMPAFLEIEAPSEDSVRKAIEILHLDNNDKWPKGERILIQEIYKLDWYDMRFDK